MKIIRQSLLGAALALAAAAMVMAQGGGGKGVLTGGWGSECKAGRAKTDSRWVGGVHSSDAKRM